MGVFEKAFETHFAKAVTVIDFAQNRDQFTFRAEISRDTVKGLFM
jgi:hypothetical protein